MRDGWVDQASGNEVGTSRQERETRQRGVNLRERPDRAATSAPPAPSGDLPCRAKPLINAFAKKLHAVGGKQEQEGVGRVRSDTALLSATSPRFAASVPFSREARLFFSPLLSRSVRTSAANSIEILVQIARALVVRVREPPLRDRARSKPHRSRVLGRHRRFSPFLFACED